VAEREVVRVADLGWLAERDAAEVLGAVRVDAWWVAVPVVEEVRLAAVEVLENHHAQHPLRPGLDARRVGAAAPGRLREEVVDAILDELVRRGDLAREEALFRLPTHAVTLGASAEPTPPTVPELAGEGFPGDLVEACVRTGRLARVSRELVISPGFLAEAETVARREAATPEGLTVLPLLISFDERHITKRDGDVRRLRGD
jgi:hypothetical protein